MATDSGGVEESTLKKEAQAILPRYREWAAAVDNGDSLKPFTDIVKVSQNRRLWAQVQILAQAPPTQPQPPPVFDAPVPREDRAVLSIGIAHMQPPEISAAWRRRLHGAGVEPQVGNQQSASQQPTNTDSAGSKASTARSPRQPNNNRNVITALLSSMLESILRYTPADEAHKLYLALQKGNFVLDHQHKQLLVGVPFKQAQTLLGPDCTDRHLPSMQLLVHGNLRVHIAKEADPWEEVEIGIHASPAAFDLATTVGIMQQLIDPKVGCILSAAPGPPSSGGNTSPSSGLAAALASAGMRYDPSLLSPDDTKPTPQPTAPLATTLKTCSITVTQAVARRLPNRIQVRRAAGTSVVLTLSGGPCFACSNCGGRHGGKKHAQCTRQHTQPTAVVDEPLLALRQPAAVDSNKTAATHPSSKPAVHVDADGFQTVQHRNTKAKAASAEPNQTSQHPAMAASTSTSTGTDANSVTTSHSTVNTTSTASTSASTVSVTPSAPAHLKASVTHTHTATARPAHTASNASVNNTAPTTVTPHVTGKHARATESAATTASTSESPTSGVHSPEHHRQRHVPTDSEQLGGADLVMADKPQPQLHA